MNAIERTIRDVVIANRILALKNRTVRGVSKYYGIYSMENSVQSPG
jgi:hypothetical protein